MGLTSLGAAEASAQDAKKEVKKERFETTTIDGVKLVGDFYPSDKGRNAPCVILLHAVGLQRSGANRRDFGKFPEKLQEKGYAVLAFDFRGYGESKEVEAKYWMLPAHQQRLRRTPTGALPRLPTRIDSKEFRTAADFAWFGNDLIAAKTWLVAKNNGSECNSSNICLIGAEQGAVVGMLWLVGEYKDLARIKVSGQPEGEDVRCVIWLSMANRLGADVVQVALESGMRGLRDKLHTLVLYGRNDSASRTFWDRAFEWIKPKNEADRYDDTNLKEIEKISLAGTRLLNNDQLKTEELIFQWLEKSMPHPPWLRNDRPPVLTPFAINLLGLPASAALPGYSRP
jgi:hypothetical protein